VKPRISPVEKYQPFNLIPEKKKKRNKQDGEKDWQA
jgi:hypothetical protein